MMEQLEMAPRLLSGIYRCPGAACEKLEIGTRRPMAKETGEPDAARQRLYPSYNPAQNSSETQNTNIHTLNQLPGI